MRDLLTGLRGVVVGAIFLTAIISGLVFISVKMGWSEHWPWDCITGEAKCSQDYPEPQRDPRDR